MSRRNRLTRIVSLTILIWTFFACAGRKQVQAPPGSLTAVLPAREASEYLQATLWVQTSAEYRTAAETVYRFAGEALDGAQADVSRTATLEQSGAYPDLPPAIILDIDETVLDNSAYHARLIMENEGFDAKLWGEWVARAQAPAIPGALDFARGAARRGIEVFFVSNRAGDEEPAIRRNLVAAGFPVKEKPDNVLLLNEQPGWGSDKSSRRAFLSHSYRIILLVGDDLGDFVSIDQLEPEGRVRLAEQHRARWGKDWFLLPNPQYGSWERALYGYQRNLTDQQILQAKKAALRPF
jgi:acid phosphatase